jgi:LysR family glycine cleavage system transcriptional activator
VESLPPLRAVEAFITIARAGSFGEAAKQLGISPSALSRRVKTLEEHLGERVFERHQAGARLTAAGQAYREAAEKALTVLALGRTEAAQAESEEVSITVPQFFANAFLAPALADFEECHPDIHLKIDTSPRVADLGDEGFDLAVRFGNGDWPPLECEPIFLSIGGPACGPRLKGGLPMPRRIEALSRHTLLHFRQNSGVWARYFEAAGHKGLRGAANRYFDDGDLLYAAACQGLGFALADPLLVGDLVERGELVFPLGAEVMTGDGFFFVFAAGRAQRPPVRRFRQWLLHLPAVRQLRQRAGQQSEWTI